MIGNLFDNAKFGDMFLTTENKQAVFLRFAENAEYKFAILYVEDWGNVQVFRHNGKEIYNDAAHSIISKQEEHVSEDLEGAAEHLSKIYAGEGSIDPKREGFAFYIGFKNGAKWQKAKDESTTEDLGEYINELSKQFPEVSFAKLSRIAVRVAKWQKQQIKKAMDLGEPPYLISVEQAYYRTLKLLED